ncbi:MAG: hypothetical protein KJO55_05400, partial [Gammaproteobacteria bacterium]|nr:hypothetical protein [Gammaproteobacteria bacterium]
MAVIDFRQLRMQLAIAATTLITASPVLGAQYWTDVDARARPGTPSNARVVTADFAQLRAVLASAPTARSGKPGVQVYLPLATAGQFALFEATESPVVEPGLAARLPDLRSYSLEGVDDPSASGRLNIDDTGLRGIVIASDGTVYIDPHQRGATDRYVSYTRSQYYADRPVPAFDCGVTSDSTTSPLHRASSAASRIANGDILRSYRLAMAGTTEYTADQGGA